MAFLESDSKSKDADKTRGTDEEIIRLFYDLEELTVRQAENLEDIQNKVLVEDAIDDPLHVTVVEVRILVGDLLDEL